MYSPLIRQLIDALRCLPGVGPKSAQRMALQLLDRDKENGLLLARILQQAINEIKRCQRCRTLTETDICYLCANSKRDTSILCVVETPADIIALEQSGSYHGLYFVLMGRLSPLDGIGPQQIGIDVLLKRVQTESIKEIIIATNPTVEGEATAHYIAHLMKKESNIPCSRLAHGIPAGGELEYLDEITLARALKARTKVEI